MRISNAFDGLNVNEYEQRIDKITAKLIYCHVADWFQNRTYKKAELDVPIPFFAGYSVIYTDRNKRDDYVVEIVKRIKEDQEERLGYEAIRFEVIEKVLKKLEKDKHFDIGSIRIEKVK